MKRDRDFVGRARFDICRDVEGRAPVACAFAHLQRQFIGTWRREPDLQATPRLVDRDGKLLARLRSERRSSMPQGGSAAVTILPRSDPARGRRAWPRAGCRRRDGDAAAGGAVSGRARVSWLREQDQRHGAADSRHDALVKGPQPADRSAWTPDTAAVAVECQRHIADRQHDLGEAFA